MLGVEEPLQRDRGGRREIEIGHPVRVDEDDLASLVALHVVIGELGLGNRGELGDGPARGRFACVPCFVAGELSRNWTRSFAITLSDRLKKTLLKVCRAKRPAMPRSALWVEFNNRRRSAGICDV